MFERLLIVALLSVASVIFYQLYTRRQLRTVSASRFTDPILQGLLPNVPTIVYFTTPMCIPCKTQQQPALDKLKTDLGENIQIVRVDATQETEAADRWGVLSAPTTFILDETGKPTVVNHGVADENKLKRQLQTQTMKAIS